MLVEGRMFNAGPDQDRELGVFFERPAAKAAPIPEIAPLTRVELKSAVALPRAAVHEYEVEGRKLFVPIVGFNAHYRFGTSHGQTSASFIVGRGGGDGGRWRRSVLTLARACSAASASASTASGCGPRAPFRPYYSYARRGSRRRRGGGARLRRFAQLLFGWAILEADEPPDLDLHGEVAGWPNVGPAFREQ